MALTAPLPDSPLSFSSVNIHRENLLLGKLIVRKDRIFRGEMALTSAVVGSGVIFPRFTNLIPMVALVIAIN